MPTPARIADMDFEGVDVNLTLPSGWFGTWSFGDDIALEMAMYRAYHRWMDDYCGACPERLGGVILAGARDSDGGLAEIRRWGKSRWAWGMMVYAPVGMPLDHPALEPFYAEAAALDLAVVLHTFTVMPPYAPGGQDTWDNLWLQRSAAHPWCGMRNMAALIGSGVMDRYPDLRVGTLEAGHGWLPFWMARLDEHAETIKAALPELSTRPSDYVMSGRYFQSIEIPEGARLTNAVADLVGDGVLMYASDYPHGESHFPESAGLVTCLGDAGTAQAAIAVGQRHQVLRAGRIGLIVAATGGAHSAGTRTGGRIRFGEADEAEHEQRGETERNPAERIDRGYRVADGIRFGRRRRARRCWRPPRRSPRRMRCRASAPRSAPPRCCAAREKRRRP